MTRRLRKIPCLTILTTLALATLAGFGAMAALGWAVAPAARVTPRSASRGPARVVRFALYDAGIMPQEARVASGRVVLSIKDFTGGTAGLVVERAEGQERRPAGVVRRAGAHWRGREEMILAPGTYYLYDSGRPENRATLVVEQ